MPDAWYMPSLHRMHRMRVTYAAARVRSSETGHDTALAACWGRNSWRSVVPIPTPPPHQRLFYSRAGRSPEFIFS